MFHSAAAKNKNVKTIVVVVLALVASLFILDRYVDLPFEAQGSSVYNPMKTYRKENKVWVKALRTNDPAYYKEYKKDIKKLDNATKCYYLGKETACRKAAQ